MSDLTPTAKVGQAPITGAVTIFIIWVLAQFGIELPSEVAAAVTIVVVFVVGYYIKDRRTPDKDTPIRADNLYAENDHSMTGGLATSAIDVVDYQSGYAAGFGTYAIDSRIARSASWELGYTRGTHDRDTNTGINPEGPDHRA